MYPSALEIVAIAFPKPVYIAAGVGFTTCIRVYTHITPSAKCATEYTTNFTVPPTWTTGLQAEHERYLTTTLGPVFITHYPTAQKPFYMLPSSSSPSTPERTPTVQNFDLLLPSVLELAGGSLREHRPDHLTRALAEKNLSGVGLEWYQDLRRYGSVPHGGFGLGFDRLVGFLAGVPSVRDVVAFPRWWGRGEC